MSTLLRYLKRVPRNLWFCFLALLALLYAFAKLDFRRARPEQFEALVIAVGYAFPSGHTMASNPVALVAAWVLGVNA